MLRQEEAVCAVYRDFIHNLSQQGTNRQKVASEIGLQAIANSHKLSDYQFQIIYDAVYKMTEPNYVTFDQFVRIHNQIKRKSLIG